MNRQSCVRAIVIIERSFVAVRDNPFNPLLLSFCAPVHRMPIGKSGSFIRERNWYRSPSGNSRRRSFISRTAPIRNFLVRCDSDFFQLERTFNSNLEHDVYFPTFFFIFLIDRICIPSFWPIYQILILNKFFWNIYIYTRINIIENIPIFHYNFARRWIVGYDKFFLSAFPPLGEGGQFYGDSVLNRN